MPNRLGAGLLNRWIYVLVRVGEDFVTPYTREGLQAVENATEYPPEFAPFLRQFLESLSAEEGWPAGSYYPGGWYRSLTNKGAQPAERALLAQADLKPRDFETLRNFFLDELRVDEQGRWFLGKKPVVGKVRDHFLANMSYDQALGRYRVRYRLENHFDTRYLHHLAPPLWVTGLKADDTVCELSLNDGARESLRTETLFLDAGERLYCAVKAQMVPARFEEALRWELLKTVREAGDGHWVITLADREIRLRTGEVWPYADKLPE